MCHSFPAVWEEKRFGVTRERGCFTRALYCFICWVDIRVCIAACFGVLMWIFRCIYVYLKYSVSCSVQSAYSHRSALPVLLLVASNRDSNVLGPGVAGALCEPATISNSSSSSASSSLSTSMLGTASEAFRSVSPSDTDDWFAKSCASMDSALGLRRTSSSDARSRSSSLDKPGLGLGSARIGVDQGLSQPNLRRRMSFTFRLRGARLGTNPASRPAVEPTRAKMTRPRHRRSSVACAAMSRFCEMISSASSRT